MIFIGAGLVLIDNMASVFDLNLLDEEKVVFKLTRLFEDKITWVAATAMVATAVALGHFKTLDLNYEKQRREIMDRIHKRRRGISEHTHL